MKAAVFMIAACAFLVAIASVSIPAVAPELVLGIVGPLVAAVTTMVLTERTYARDPRKLTPLMIKAFGVKMVLFPAYVAAVITLTPLSSIPFVLSFCVSFICVHLTEAWQLRSLFAEAIS